MASVLILSVGRVVVETLVVSPSEEEVEIECSESEVFESADRLFKVVGPREMFGDCDVATLNATIPENTMTTMTAIVMIIEVFDI